MKKRIEKVEVGNIKVDPIVVDMPKMKAEFVRFESTPDGKRFFVVYEIKPEGEK